MGPVNSKTVSSIRTVNKISILTEVAQREQVIKSHGQASSKSSVFSPIGSTKNNVSKAAKRAAMASYGAIPGPIDSIAINHPDRGPPRTAKGRSNSQIFCHDVKTTGIQFTKKQNWCTTTFLLRFLRIQH